MLSERQLSTLSVLKTVIPLRAFRFAPMPVANLGISASQKRTLDCGLADRVRRPRCDSQKPIVTTAMMLTMNQAG
jgi:hypothetical protein